MEALRQLIKPTNGRITIAIPEEYADKELEIIIRPISLDNDSASTSKKNYDFSNLSGKLQWKGDALKEQQKLRDEWR